jgi:predicted nucleic acid-binding protein
MKGFLPDLKGAIEALKMSGFRISDAVNASILKIIG